MCLNSIEACVQNVISLIPTDLSNLKYIRLCLKLAIWLNVDDCGWGTNSKTHLLCNTNMPMALCEFGLTIEGKI